ncbi:hypothetical protein GCM10023147_45920 [Tsukamurella soli]|uniref:Uncharacterized protein n=1 Tax=Tsukamurella soli TaxID=644556 RepID=A0ABP8KC32_9ACTN
MSVSTPRISPGDPDLGHPVIQKQGVTLGDRDDRVTQIPPPSVSVTLGGVHDLSGSVPEINYNKQKKGASYKELDTAASPPGCIPPRG